MYTLATYAFDHTHSQWQQILSSHVVNKGHQTLVNYKKIKENPEVLNKYLKSLSSVTQLDFKKWSNEQKLCFYINAYNAFTFKLIIDNYPLASIKDLVSFFSSPWKKKFIVLFGKKVHLDYREHDIMGKEFNEPRIHFAINCASLGCPPLSGKASIADRLEKYFLLNKILISINVVT